MTTTAEQIQELSATLDHDVAEAERKAEEAEANLLRAQQECDAAKKAVVQAHRHRAGFRKTFAEVLSLDGEDAPQEGSEDPEQASVEAGNDNDAAAEENVSEEDSYSRSLQLVPAKARAKPSLAKMTQKDQLRHILGDRTLTLAELREEFQARKLDPSEITGLLSKSKHNVLDANGKPRRDPKTGALIKQNSFVSPKRGSWRVADPEGSSGVLTRGEAQAEMHRRKMG